MILLCSFQVQSQSMVRRYWDDLFPNNKHHRIEVLTHQLDSVRKNEDSLARTVIKLNEELYNANTELSSTKECLVREQSSSKTTVKGLETELKTLKDSVRTMSFYHVYCNEETIGANNDEDPVLKNTCHWRNYRIIETGKPDHRGRYEWNSELFRVENDSLVKMDITDLFIADSIQTLEALLNAKLKEDFDYLAETNRNCFPRHIEYPGYKLKDMRFFINDNSQVSFEIALGLSNYCQAVNFVSTTFKINELKKYFR